MEKMQVRDLMRPIDEFPRISNHATLMEAVEALQEADKEFQAGRSPQRILLVYDEAGHVVGKISPMDVVQGLEPNYDNIEALKHMPRYHLAPSVVDSMKEELLLWQRPLAELCSKATGVKIGNFIKLPTPDHMVNANDRMDKAFHWFVVGRHDSLFVKEGERIVGVIRFSDVYRKITQTMRECPAPQ
ncbi:CBS domain-containing protein [Desulfoferrobacter suflitae]|uniref:CBS domain-containing protein n=1 Tax=Desulfoferrobacter suflitae TaxID=2865782 RepID=UPI00216474DA|nr:CBS domain-containing protein [Desulfoferrobacter suflitae]MCK8600355.1 CBS domain-containing protein [Desulfoferrobacter suflitae]